MIPPPPRSTLFPYTTLFRSTPHGRMLPWRFPCASASWATSTLSFALITPPMIPFNTLRSEEHTSELQSRENLVCRLLLEKKKNKRNNNTYTITYTEHCQW